MGIVGLIFVFIGKEALPIVTSPEVRAEAGLARMFLPLAPTRYADLLRIPLTSVDQRSYRIGERAAALALKLIEAEEVPAPRRVILPIELVPRGSTARVARRRSMAS